MTSLASAMLTTLQMTRKATLYATFPARLTEMLRSRMVERPSGPRDWDALGLNTVYNVAGLGRAGLQARVPRPQ